MTFIATAGMVKLERKGPPNMYFANDGDAGLGNELNTGQEGSVAT